VRRRRRKDNTAKRPALEALEPRLLLDAAGLPAALDYDPAWIVDVPELPAPPAAGVAAGLSLASQDEWTGVFDILVEPGLLASIQGALDTYVADLTAEGYTVLVSEWSGPAEALRSHLRDRYDAAGLEGALFVGDLPTLLYTNANDFTTTATFIHDLYFMDLDGTYVLSDTEPDQHLANAGDITPEIYVSRITTSTITALTGETEAGLINRYFARVHDYRTGVLTYEDRGILWSDDDWQYTDYYMAGDALYHDVLNIRDPAETTRQSYVDSLGLDYESMMFMAHSGATSHSIGGVGSGGISSAQIRDINPRQAFYNLWNCSSGNFNVPGNLICTYVYGGDYGLNAVGTTKTGSMLGSQHFYGFQGEGMSLGQAFRRWWETVGIGTESLRRWLYGMIMQGDPTLRPASMGDATLVADAGPDRVVEPGAAVMLDGSASHYEGGREPVWHWEQVSGPPVQIEAADQPVATFTPTEEGTYVFRLTVEVSPLVGTDEVTFRTRDPDLLGFWTFDEGAGSIAHDASGNGHDGQIIGADWEPDGRVGGALRFYGSGDWVLDDDAEDYLNGLRALTVAMWIKSGETGSDRGFLTTRNPALGGPDNKDCLLLRYDDEGSNGHGDDVIKVYVQTTTDKHHSEGAPHTQTTEWQHVALTWSSYEAIALYVDGVRQVLTYDEGELGDLTSNAEELRIGAANYGDWIGLIDEVRIYNCELSAEEIAALANLDPVAAGEAYEIGQDTPLDVDVLGGVLANDRDGDDGPQGLRAFVVHRPGHGELDLAPNGSFLYTPEPGFCGTDSFTYRAGDGLEYSNVATVTITVRDTVPPAVAAARVEPVDGRIVIDFSEPVWLTRDDVVLLNGQAVPIDLSAATLSLTDGGRTATLAFPQRPEADYCRLLLGSESVHDLWSNDLDGDGDGLPGGSYQAVLMIPLLGDATLDGAVDVADYLSAKRYLGTPRDVTWGRGDFDGDGDADGDDLLLLEADFGRVLSDPAPIPEGFGETDRPADSAAEATAAEAVTPLADALLAPPAFAGPDGPRTEAPSAPPAWFSVRMLLPPGPAEGHVHPAPPVFTTPEPQPLEAGSAAGATLDAAADRLDVLSLAPLLPPAL